MMIWRKRGNYTSIEQMYLQNMNVSSTDEVNEWYRKSYNNNYKIKGLREAVEFAKKFVDKKVTIVGDYDADGVTATSILYLGLKEFGFKNVSYRIPLRFSEGFGINQTIIDDIDTGLIITCDNGIAGIDAVRAAKEKGLSVIVTDHHQPYVEKGKEILPDADYIIDPNAIHGSADFNGYCGAGIAYKFICELFEYKKSITHKYLGLAAIGTIADVMKLHEENTVIVRDGLKALANPSLCTTGLSALVQAFDLKQPIADDIAYKIGPAINSSSRMNDAGAYDAVRLLTYCGDVSTAMEMALAIKKTNDARKDLESELSKRCERIIKEEKRENLCPLTVYIPDAHEGIIGIIAGKMCEKYLVPTLVFTNIRKNGKILYKGSGRSCGSYDIKKAFDQHSDLFVAYGGHADAAGMTILPENFEKLTNVLNNDPHGFAKIDDNIAYYDIEILPDEIQETINKLSKFEPYGNGNPRPVIMVNNIHPAIRNGSYRSIIGKTGDTIKINTSTDLVVLGFHMASDFKDIDERTPFRAIGKLNMNEYKGKITPQIFLDLFQVI